MDKADEEAAGEAEIKSERAGSVDVSLNGRANVTNTDRDELDSSPALDEELSEIAEEEGLGATAASRRRAMKEKAAEREAEESIRLAKIAQDKLRANETKAQAAERKRLTDEFVALSTKIRHVDYDLRAHMYALRTRPMGIDRWGNKVWWMDGLGSAPLVNDKGAITYGTGRVYVQGVYQAELDALVNAVEDLDRSGLEQKRKADEGEVLAPGEWGCYDTPEQVSAELLQSAVAQR